MKFGRYGWSYLFLRVGLGITFLWIGVDMLRQPDTWLGYMPTVLPWAMTPELGLKWAALFDISIGILLLLRVWLKLIGLLAVVYLLGVIVTTGVDAVLIRNVGLLGAALALLFWPTHYHRKKRWWQGRWGLFRGRKEDFGEE